MTQDTQTRASLLRQLKDPQNDAAWRQFVELYGTMIYRWCLYWKLQTVDAEEVTQMLTVKLFQRLKEFDYDRSQGSFRGWLKTVTHNAVRDFCRRKSARHGDSSVWRQLADVAACDDFATRVEQTYDLELLEFAKTNVQRRVASHTWQIFELFSEGRNAKEVASQTGLRIATVYVAKSKVIRMLQDEVRALENDE